MSYGRMEKKAVELREEVDRLLSQAEAVDAEKDLLYDKQQLKPVLEKVERNTHGEMPKVVSTDSGYFSESNCILLESKRIKSSINSTGVSTGKTPNY